MYVCMCERGEWEEPDMRSQNAEVALGSKLQLDCNWVNKGAIQQS